MDGCGCAGAQMYIILKLNSLPFFHSNLIPGLWIPIHILKMINEATAVWRWGSEHIAVQMTGHKNMEQWKQCGSGAQCKTENERQISAIWVSMLVIKQLMGLLFWFSVFSMFGDSWQSVQTVSVCFQITAWVCLDQKHLKKSKKVSPLALRVIALIKMRTKCISIWPWLLASWWESKQLV